MQNTHGNQAWLALRTTFGLIPIAAGLDKFFNLLTSWEQYLSPLAKTVLPIDAGVLMRGVGLVEIAVGLLVLSRWTRIGAYLASAWLVLIALNLLVAGHFFDVAARDLALAAAAFALGRLAEVRNEARAASPQSGIHPLETAAQN